jgi:GNAT superfamily N-acetyltransferase
MTPHNNTTTVRLTKPADRDAIMAFVTATGFFRPDEIAIAQDVLDDALAEGADGLYGYRSYTAVLDGKPVGWICFGPTPCTLGTYDIYWIVVAREHHRMGIGKILLAQAETCIRDASGRVAVIETSSKELYDPTRAFYLKHAYFEEARLRDFYAPGDDKVVYLKRFA